jgi:hypothetical protein
MRVLVCGGRDYGELVIEPQGEHEEIAKKLVRLAGTLGKGPRLHHRLPGLSGYAGEADGES